MDKRIYEPTAEDKRYLEALGTRIKTLREKKGISQIEMARRLETGNSQIRKVEVGANSSIIMLMRIAKELDTTIEKLVKGL